MTDQQIVPGAGPTPVAITLDVAQRLLPKLAFASFDGTGAAGDFLPVVRFVGPGGAIAGQAVGDVVTAGASVDQTWFRGLAKQGAAAGGGLQFDTDNEGGWFYGGVNDGLGGPNGYGWEFNTDGSGLPFAVTGDGGFIVDTAGAVTLDAGSGLVASGGAGNSAALDSFGNITETIGEAAPGTHEWSVEDHTGTPLFSVADDGTIDAQGHKIVNGADGVNPTDFATVGQISGGGGVTDLDGITGSVTLVAGANVTIADNSPGAGDITISATGGGGGGGGIIAYAKRTTGSPITTSATTFAGGVNLLAASLSFVADGTSDYLIEVSAPIIANNTSGAEAQLNLVLDGADAGRFYFILTSGSVSGNEGVGLHGRGVVVAPSAGTHTINIRLWSGVGGTSLVQFGPGGAANDAPVAVTVESQ